MEKNDNKLFKKIAEYLMSVKQPLHEHKNDDPQIPQKKQPDRFSEEDIVSDECTESNNNIQEHTELPLSAGTASSIASSTPSVPTESPDEAVSLLSLTIASSPSSSLF